MLLASFDKECILYDRYCIECGECNICDLDKNKICDNCCKCIDENADYVGIDIDDVIIEEDCEEDIEKLQHNWKYSETYSIDINEGDKKFTD